jgi:hypothetical protein
MVRRLKKVIPSPTVLPLWAKGTTRPSDRRGCPTRTISLVTGQILDSPVVRKFSSGIGLGMDVSFVSSPSVVGLAGASVI